MVNKRQTLRTIFQGIRLNRLDTMGLIVKDPFVARYHGVNRVGGLNEGLVRARLLYPQRVSVNGGNCFKINAGNEFNLRGCSEEFPRRNDRFQKSHAIAPYPELLRVSDSHVDFGKKVNGKGGVERGGRLDFPGRSLDEKLVVAVDVDEVLGNFVSALNEFIADRYSSKHCVSEYHVYEFFKIWNCSRDEADVRVHEFFKTSYFKKGIHPLPGAQSALHKLSEYCNLSIVTSRQNVIKDHTIEWLEEHYPGLFQEIHFGNHFALDGTSRPKSDICRSLGAHVLIDDNPRYAIECADAGMRVLLFDYENTYPWSKTDSAIQHPGVTKVHNWVEVEKQLLSWVVS